MMRGIIMSSMKARLVVASVAAILIVFGLLQLRNMQLGIFPEFSPVYVEVQTEALGLSADEVEQLLTVALEQDLLNGIAYLDEIWSESMPGLSRVVCVFEPGTDPMVARQVVAERLTQAHALPHVSKPPVMLQPYSSTSRVMKVGLTPSSQELSLIDLSVLARWTIQPYLMGVEGVANVSIWGQRKRQLQVQVNPETLAGNGVVLQDVIKTTGEALWVSPLSYLNSSTPGTGGFFDTPNQRLGIRHVLPITTPEELAQIPLYGHPDKLLGDVSTVVENHQPLIGDAIVNDSPGLMLVIEKFPWASTVKVSEAVEDALDKLAPGLAGVSFDTEIYMPANFIEASFDNLSVTMGIGLAIVLLLIFLFFYEWRTALVSFISILLSLTAGAYVLYLQGTIFDMMVLAGLIVALGVIVDDAVSTVENIRRRLQEAADAGSEKTTAVIIRDAAAEIRSPIFFATMILVLTVLPMYFIEGVSGAFLTPLATSYMLALAASTLTALIVTPALSYMFLSRSNTGYRQSPLLAPVKAAFGSGISGIIQKPAMGFITLAVIAVIGLLALSMINLGPRLPIPQERDLVVKWDAPYGTSHPEMTRITKEAIGKLRTVDGVTNVAAHIGRAVMSDKVSNVHAGEIWINMDEDADYDKTLASIQEVVDGFSGMSTEVTTYQRQSLNKSLTGSNHLYAVRVFGENQDILTQKAEEVQKAISGIGGISSPKVEYPPMEPNIEIRVDLEKAREYDIKPGEVRRTAATLLSGINVGSLFEGQKVFEVVVWGVPEVRKSIESVKNLLVDTPDGGQVRIGDVAEVREKANPAVVRRDKVSRFMDVTFNVEGRNRTLSADIDRSLAQVDFPLEYHAELVGDFLKIQEAESRVRGIVIASLIGIFLLLQAAFWSWRLALVVFPSLLVTLSGGMVAVLLNGGNLTLGHLAGLLAVLGIATYNGVLLIKHFKRRELIDGENFGAELVQNVVRDRVGPILMTTIITLGAFLPFAFLGGNVPGLEMLHPMSLVMIGGLVSSLLVNLLVMPALYLQFGKVPDTVIEEEKAMLELDVDTVPSI
ncbi:MAG: efflux RND transporter permease subunit [Lewinellaceae bacterium]|nr:efflux RND transporter permease subunit [Lewinellaceae bacterium]